MSVQSNSDRQFEFDLLRTLTTTIDNENLVMTDDLLDGDLESIALNQSRQLSIVSQVPYKGVSGSQAGKS